jgi:hypothetical protein
MRAISFNPVGTAFPTFRLNQFGGSLGGPVVVPKLYHGKDRTFFFVDYEGYRRDAQQLQLGNIPTLRMRNGDFGETATIYDPVHHPGESVPDSYVRRLPAIKFR